MDYPLGRTAGKPKDPIDQDHVVRAALQVLSEASTPGQIAVIDTTWGQDDWRAHPLGGGGGSAGSDGRDSSGSQSDARTERLDTPQYQNPEDARNAALRHGEDISCAACVGFDA